MPGTNENHAAHAPHDSAESRTPCTKGNCGEGHTTQASHTTSGKACESAEPATCPSHTPGSEARRQPACAPMPGPEAVKPHLSCLTPPDAPCPTEGHTPPGREPMMPGTRKTPDNSSDKTRDMNCRRACPKGMPLTTSTGVKVADNQNTLSAGASGPLLLEDFHFIDKLGHFDRERIPERVVHARGSGAYGYFEVYQSCAEFTKAAFLCDPTVRTPVFVRFSTVQGALGSADTVRDIRGFAVKFYTSEGNFDLVGNDTPVFFIQDPLKFPDFVHAVKPEPHNEMPQGQSAHDSFWDYVSLQPETLHNVMWAMSDRGIPRSYRTMEGFGIHTFRMVNEKGKSCFVRFHWKPLYGKASLVWDEAQLLTGRDPDFHRRDLWQAIEAGDYPEYELGVQIIEEKDEYAFGFDIMDPTKLIPEALVPVRRIGKMVLDRNPDNFFAETEQAAFCPANLVPGIDFSDDPLLHGRTFSYVDTQRHRLGTANFNELPINRPLVPVRNHQRGGFFRQQIDGGANYEPNSIGGNWPRETAPAPHGGGFQSIASSPRIEHIRARLRSPSFAEYYTQPRFFYLSLTEPEKKHLASAFGFELSKVSRCYIRERVVDLLSRVDTALAQEVAEMLGMHLSADQLKREMPGPVKGMLCDPALSLYATGEQVLKGRRVALLCSDGVCEASVMEMRRILGEYGVHSALLAPHMGCVKTKEGGCLKVDGTIAGEPSVLFDAVAVPEGMRSLEALSQCGKARHYLWEAYRHLKPIALPGDASAMMLTSGLPEGGDSGLILEKDSKTAMARFLAAMKKHRIWSREHHTCSMPKCEKHA